MIQMMRMHLINWHNFIDDIIDFKNVTYLIGLNAVGKTTIMDAIRYCLTTNKDFNAAGNRKSGRTLQGSVHQKQRAEDSYLRPNHTVTYIGIEFLDEAIHKTFVISVRVESESPKQELRHVSQDWYISKTGYSLDDIPFFTNTKAGRRPASREEFKLDNKGLEKAPSQGEARRRISRVLGIGDADSPIGKKFNEVFHMGTSLEDINDIRKFIYTYILPEPEINVEVLHKDMRELERLQEILEEAQEREKILAEINEKILLAKELDSKVKVNEALVGYAKLQDAIEQQEEEKRRILQAKSTIEICENKLNELSEKEEEADWQLYNARKDVDDNQENKALSYLEEENESKNKEYTKLVRNAAKFDEIYGQMKKLMKQISSLDIQCNFDIAIIGDEEALLESKIHAIQSAKKALYDVSEVIKENDAEIRNRVRTLKDEIDELILKINKLEAGTMCYPKEAELVRDSINEKLLELGRKPDAKLFCELLYMNDSQWQDAVESYLNTQRFNVIVAPDDYLIAKAVFVSLQDKVRGIGLVDTMRLMKRNNSNKSNEKMLSFTVESKNPYARAYADYLMGGVVCCETKEDLELHNKSVTKDRLRYQSYCLQRMKEQDRFIGIEALQQQLENARILLKNRRQEQQEIETRKKSYSDLDGMYRVFISGNAFIDLEAFCGSKEEADQLYESISEIKQQIEAFKKNPILRSMYNRVEECEKRYTELKNLITDTKSDKKIAEDIIRNSELVIASLLQNMEEAQEEYNVIIESHALFIETVVTKYNDERRNKRASAIVYNFANRISQDLKALEKYLNLELLPLQRTYMGTYTCDYPEGLAGAERYRQAYASLVNISLEQHKDALNRAQIRCKERFRKEILFRMKDDILRAKQQFRQLNKVMEHLSYGEESYRFSIDGNKDKELSIFYNIIMDKDNQQIDEENEIMAFIATNQSKVFESQIEEFMQRIMVDVENHAQEILTGQKNGSKNISAYVDYRTYLDYDIIVKNAVTGLEVPLSKVSGDGSGGENQAPFYVSICASLLQIYQQSDNCIRLVLLDEAFNNMTSDRIEPMMKMFRDLNLQLVLIATPEKCTSIFPYCDLTYSIVKQGSRNAIAAFEGV